MSTSTSPDRLHGLDALRGGALLLGVGLHASMAYLPTPIWPIADAATSPLAGAGFFVIHTFRMLAFFVIAGLFAHLLLTRRGVKGFIRNRLIRIAGPLFGMWWLVFPAVIAVIVWKAALDNGGVIPTDGPPPPPLSLAAFPLLHLWFLWLLLVLYAGALLLRIPVLALDRSGGLRRRLDRAAGVLVGPWAPVLLATPLALALWATPGWIPFLGIPTPDRGLIPNPAALTAYGSAFAFGFMLDRRRDLLLRIERMWLRFTAFGLGAAIVALMIAGGPGASLAAEADPVGKFAAAVSYALAGWTLALAALALCLRFLSGYSPVRRYLADASYWIYIVHLPLVMAAQVLLLDIDIPGWLKMAAGVAGVGVVSTLSYELLVRHTFLGRVLNGRRVPWRGGAESAALPAQ